MTQLPTPQAKRLRRPSWKDSRLVVGVLLVLLAATLGAKAVSSADDRVPHYVAASDLAAGDEVTSASFTRVDIRLGDGVTDYLRADAAALQGRFLLRDLRRGELVPSSALGTSSDVTTQRLTLQVDSVSATGLGTGSVVDVFVSAVPDGASSRAKPQATKALEGVSVAAVLTDTGGFGSAATTSVQLRVPKEKVLSVVEAVDAESRITLVPVAGSAVSVGS